MEKLKAIVGLLAILSCAALLFGGAMYLEYKVWTECRSANSWLYCVRTVTR